MEMADSDSGCSDAEGSIDVPVESVDVAEVVASADGEIATCAAEGCEQSDSEDGLLLLQNQVCVCVFLPPFPCVILNVEFAKFEISLNKFLCFAS